MPLCHVLIAEQKSLKSHPTCWRYTNKIIIIIIIKSAFSV